MESCKDSGRLWGMKDKKIPMVGGPQDGTTLPYTTRWPQYVDEAGNTMATAQGGKMAAQAAMGLPCAPGYVYVQGVYVHTGSLRDFLAPHSGAVL